MHKHFLLQALELAKIRRGFCAPNPAVGAVIVKDKKVIASGYHYQAGLPHAEIEALNKLTDEQARGATIYITLEPCCHQGKTPPCTDELIKRGISQVIYGYSDPNPLVKNKSTQQLRLANIDCELLELPEMMAFYKSYEYWHGTHKPFVTAKLALSLDGKIAGPGGTPIQITSEAARKFTHQHRYVSDALLTTAKTINQDNPQLNVRLDNVITSKPIYLIDQNLSTNPHSQIFNTAKDLCIFHRANVDQAVKKTLMKQNNIRLLAISESDNGLNINEILQIIGNEGCHDLWIEAGGKLTQHLIGANLVQRLYLLIGLKWLDLSALNAFDANIDLLKNVKSISWHSLDIDGLCQIDYL